MLKKKQKHQNMHQNDLTSIKILELCRKSKDHFFCFMNPFCLLVQQRIYLIALQHLFLKTQFLVNFEKLTIIWDMTKLGKGHDSNSGFKLQVTLHHCKSWGILPMQINFWCQPIILLCSILTLTSYRWKFNSPQNNNFIKQQEKFAANTEKGNEVETFRRWCATIKKYK